MGSGRLCSERNKGRDLWLPDLYRLSSELVVLLGCAEPANARGEGGGVDLFYCASLARTRLWILAWLLGSEFTSQQRRSSSILMRRMRPRSKPSSRTPR